MSRDVMFHENGDVTILDDDGNPIVTFDPEEQETGKGRPVRGPDGRVMGSATDRAAP